MRMHQLSVLAQASSNEGVSTGVIVVTALAIAVPLVSIVVWLRYDYYRHKRPLQEALPDVRYTFWHHIRVVTIPLLSYRISFYISKKTKHKRLT